MLRMGDALLGDWQRRGEGVERRWSGVGIGFRKCGIRFGIGRRPHVRIERRGGSESPRKLDVQCHREWEAVRAWFVACSTMESPSLAAQNAAQQWHIVFAMHVQASQDGGIVGEHADAQTREQMKRKIQRANEQPGHNAKGSP
jgi:hypothetical protein